jgi:hypothetical protein
VSDPVVRLAAVADPIELLTCGAPLRLADDIRSLFPALVELERARADAGAELTGEVAAPPVIRRPG